MAVLVLGLLILNIVKAAPPSGPRIARLSVTGMILNDPARDAVIVALAADDDVRAIIVRIDSPGGTTVASEVIFEELREAGRNKPIVAVMDGVAASGGYITALAADHIVARGNTMTASIGVIAQYPQVSGLMDKLGVEMREMRSSPLKAAPSPFSPATDAALAVQRAMIDDSYAWFRGLVADRRGLSGPALDAVADGRVLTGRMALDAGLVDAIGGEDVAIAWLEDARGVVPGLPVRDARTEDKPETLFDILIERFVGRVAVGAFLGDAPGSGTLKRALMGPRLMSVLD